MKTDDRFRLKKGGQGNALARLETKTFMQQALACAKGLFHNKFACLCAVGTRRLGYVNA